MDVVILGQGGHGRDVEAVALACGAFTSYFDDEKGEPCNTPIRPGQTYTIGVWNPHVRASLDRREDPAASLIHPSAHIGPGCVLGAGVVIGPHVSLGADVHLGRHVHVGDGARLTRCTVGDYTTISNGAVVCGDVTIGKEVTVGANATIKNLLTIGDSAVIGCGANVVRPVDANAQAIGNPAKEAA